MTVYLAAPAAYKHAMPAIAEQWRAAGFIISEPWWERNDFLPYDDPDFHHPKNHAALEDQAVRDFMGVHNAQAVIVYNTEPSEGKATEMGIAFAYNKPIVLVGKRSRNVFHYMPSVYPVRDTKAAIRKLAS